LNPNAEIGLGLETERGCVVLDQPQRVIKKRVPDYFEADAVANLLRLVCDTAALRPISDSYFRVRVEPAPLKFP